MFVHTGNRAKKIQIFAHNVSDPRMTVLHGPKTCPNDIQKYLEIEPQPTVTNL